MTFAMDTVGSRPGKSGYGEHQSHSRDGGNHEGHGGDGVLQNARSVLMPVCVPGPVEVPCVAHGRYCMAQGRACSATGISAVGRGGPRHYSGKRPQR